nr:KUP/HAK/KT family potassium transporter [Nakamurella panacisegetis]
MTSENEPRPAPAGSAVADAREPITPSAAHRTGLFGLALGAIGVVFGDIGTSPLYAMQTVFSIDHNAVQPTSNDVYGVISLVFWSITLIVSVKYVVFILRADNDGEGGIMALAALIRRQLGTRSRRVAVAMILGVIGAALFYGDSLITPAISVLSAVEGIEVVAPSAHRVVLPVGIAIVAVLFLVQRIGTHKIGRLFAPVMVVWFVVLAVTGLPQIVAHPGILRGLSPPTSSVSSPITPTPRSSRWALWSCRSPEPRRSTPTWGTSGDGRSAPPGSSSSSRPWSSTTSAGCPDPAHAVGHRQPVLPAGTELGSDPVGRPGHLRHRHRQPGRHLRCLLRLPAGGPARVPAAADRPAHLEGRGRPDLRSGSQLAAVRRRVRADDHLRIVQQAGHAYGLAVTGTLLLTTTLFLILAGSSWRWPMWRLVVIGVVFGGVELTFFAANLTKVVHGGWLPLIIARRSSPS